MMRRLFSFNISHIVEALRLAWRMFNVYKKKILILAVLGVVGGFLEAIGANALVPLFSFFVKTGDVAPGTDTITTFIQHVFAFLSIPFNLPSLLIFICLLFLLKALSTVYFNYIRVGIRTGYERDTMDSLYRDTLHTNWPYLSKQKIGHLDTVIMTNVRQSSSLLETIAFNVGVVTEFLMYFTISFSISKTITTMTLIFGATIFFLYKPLLFKIRSLSRHIEGLNREVSRHVNESIGGLKSIKAMGSENIFADISSSYFNTLRTLYIKLATIQSLTIAQPIGVIFMSIVVAFTYYRTSYNLGALAAIIYLIQKMFGHFQNLQTFAQTINSGIPYVQRVLEYQDKAIMFKEKHDNENNTSFSFKKILSFENVQFSYDTGDVVLNGISFSVEKGATVGFIGKSGAGKTTIFDLILRLLKPTSGKIKVDDTSINDIDISLWRDHIAYVPQDAFLLNDTIYNNIIFYNKNIKKDDVEYAVKLAHLEDFIKELKDGYETIVGERGVRLSGGQRQRIAIARALARRPEILLLDEATSALDVESEAYVQEAIKELKGKITILIIAHRLSTVAHSDILVVLEDGKIIETCNPSDLLKDKETYYRRVYDIHN